MAIREIGLQTQGSRSMSDHEAPPLRLAFTGSATQVGRISPGAVPTRSAPLATDRVSANCVPLYEGQLFVQPDDDYAVGLVSGSEALRAMLYQPPPRPPTPPPSIDCLAAQTAQIAAVEVRAGASVAHIQELVDNYTAELITRGKLRPADELAYRAVLAQRITAFRDRLQTLGRNAKRNSLVAALLFVPFAGTAGGFGVLTHHFSVVGQNTHGSAQPPSTYGQQAAANRAPNHFQPPGPAERSGYLIGSGAMTFVFGIPACTFPAVSINLLRAGWARTAEAGLCTKLLHALAETPRASV